MKYIIDAYAWIEYLEGSEQGEKVYKILNADNEIFTLPITISEVVSKVKRNNGNSSLAYDAIISNSKILQSTTVVTKEAGLLHAELRKKKSSIGIVDCLLISHARSIKARILTGDNHFKNFKEAVML